MDLISLGQVFFISMFLICYTGNFMTFKSNVRHVFSNINGSLIGLNFLPKLWVSVNKKHPPCLWWKELRQYTHWDLVETNVWHTTLKTKDNFFLLHDKMNFEAFNNLVLEFNTILAIKLLEPY